MNELINISSLNGYRELVTQLGGDSDFLLRQAGIEPNALGIVDHYIPYRVMCELLETSATALNEPCFGILLSDKQTTSVLGILGLLLEKSSNVEMATKYAQRYFDCHTQGADLSLSKSGTTSFMQYEVIAEIPRSRQIIEFALGSICRCCQLLVGAAWEAKGIYFSHAPLAKKSHYVKAFNAPVVFNHEHNGVTFDASLLAKNLRSYDPSLEYYLKKQIESLAQQAIRSFPAKIRKLIAQQLPNGGGSLKDIANQLAICPRSLQYKLAKHNTSFFEILDQERARVAKRFLESSTVSLSQLYIILGYADQSTFSRSFKRWFGISPSQWKKNKRAL